MKKIYVCFMLSAVLAACAGNPPAWWNPNNRYGTPDTTQQTRVQKRAQAAVTEENIDPLPDANYEEVVLTPISDEENENTSGASSGQSQPDGPENLPAPSVLE